MVFTKALPLKSGFSKDSMIVRRSRLIFALSFWGAGSSSRFRSIKMFRAGTSFRSPCHEVSCKTIYLNVPYRCFLMVVLSWSSILFRALHEGSLVSTWLNTYSRSSSRSSSSRSSSSSKACYLQSLLHWHTMKYPTLWNIKGTLPLFRVLEY